MVSLNITKWALQAAREGQLTAAARRTGSLIRAAELFYVGTFYEFYKRYDATPYPLLPCAFHLCAARLLRL